MKPYNLVRSQEEFNKIEFDYNEPIFCDTETSTNEGKSKGGLYGKVRLVQAYQVGWRQAVIIDCLFVPLRSVLKKLQKGTLIFHNGSYDLHAINLHTDDLWLPHDVHDTLYLSRLVLFDRGSKFTFYDCLEMSGLADETIRGIDKKKNQKADWGGPLSNELLFYAAYDVLYLSLLYNKVKAAEITESYELDITNLKYAIKYNRRGIPTDKARIHTERGLAIVELEDILNDLQFNPGSAKVCCQKLGTTSSDVDVLSKLSLGGNQLAGKISRARSLVKTINFLNRYDRDVIKGFHNPAGAVSGRFTCSGGDSFDHANLQQIPRLLLACLVAAYGRTLVYKDYAGLELRMAVCFTGDPTMESLMRKGVDVHTHTGCVIFQCTEDKLTGTQRFVGKICNFLLIYGGGIHVLQAVLRQKGGMLVEYKECKRIREAWFREYTYFEEWHNMVKRHLNIYNYLDITTALGREVRCTNLNNALNYPIQGSSAEVIKMSLKFLSERYPDENLINTIHDSNTLMPIVSEADLWVDRLNEVMIDAWYYVIQSTVLPDLPMPAEAKQSTRWDF